MNKLKEKFVEIIDALPEHDYWQIYRFIPALARPLDTGARDTLIDVLLAAVCAERGCEPIETYQSVGHPIGGGGWVEHPVGPSVLTCRWCGKEVKP